MKAVMIKVQGVAAALVLLSIAGQAGASLRPFGSPATLSEVQGVFDDIGSTLDAYNDQSSEALFEPTGTGNSVASYIATVSWAPGGDVEFGIYNMANPSQQVALFNYSDNPNPGDSVVVQFDQGADYVRTVDLSTLTVYDSSTYFKEFGYYASASGYGTFFSEDDLNPGGFAHLLTYEGKGDQVTIGSSGTYSDINHWYVAAETGTPFDDTTSSDFSDMIVQMESITPIPEPGSVTLIVASAAGIAFIRRRLA